MLQHWATEGEFYIGGFVLRNFIEPDTLYPTSMSRLHLRVAGSHAGPDCQSLNIIESVDSIGAFALALQSGSKPLQSRSARKFSREWIKSGSVRSTYGRWMEDGSRSNRFN